MASINIQSTSYFLQSSRCFLLIRELDHLLSQTSLNNTCIMKNIERWDFAYDGNFDFNLIHSGKSIFWASKWQSYSLKLINTIRCYKWNTDGNSYDFLYFLLPVFTNFTNFFKKIHNCKVTHFDIVHHIVFVTYCYKGHHYSTLTRPLWNNISTTSLRIGSIPLWWTAMPLFNSSDMVNTYKADNE